jgi:CubicO group peptidase (beta-lactamase class C family)
MPLPPAPAIALALASCAPTAAPQDDPPLPDTWLVQVRREHFDPRDIDYLVRLEQTEAGWTGRATIDALLAGRTTVPVSEVVRTDGHLSLTLGQPGGWPPTVLAGPLRDGLWTGAHSWQGPLRAHQGHFVAHPRTVLRLEGTADPRLPDTADPAATGLDPLLLDRLVLAAEESRTDQLIVVSDGKVVARRHFGGADRPMRLQSITKPIASLALGMLEAEGQLGGPDGIDTPVAHWLPALDDGTRGGVTLRHLLTHTSGLDPEGTLPLTRAPDRLAVSLETPALHAPGTKAAYNNRAFNLLSGVIRAAAGEEPSAYLGPRLFGPLGMDSVSWATDRAGHEPVYIGLSMTATDLAVLGQVLCEEGRWGDQQVVPEAWMSRMFRASVPAAPRRGLSWALRPEPVLTPPPPPSEETHVGFGHTGTQGQQLWFHPDVDLVVVRLIDLTDVGWGIQESRDAMNDLALMVDALAKDKRQRTRR